MPGYTTDEEQLEVLKEWWKNYGKMTVVAIIIAIVASFGWRYWGNHREQVGQQASNLYEQMLTMQSKQDVKQTKMIAMQLYQNYKNTPYAKLAELLVAKLAVEQGDFESAENALHFVMQKSRSSQLRQIARLRLARLKIEQKDYDAALQIVKKIEDKAYLGLIAQVQGDVYTLQNHIELARKAYMLALQELPADNGNITLVQMKLSNLG